MIYIFWNRLLIWMQKGGSKKMDPGNYRSETSSRVATAAPALRDKYPVQNVLILLTRSKNLKYCLSYL